jgi:hypothetical protein
MKTNSLLSAVAAFTLSTAPISALEVPCGQHSDPRLATMSDEGIGTTSALGLADGRYALPESASPTQLVVMFHGHGNDSCSWRNHLRAAAAHGAVTFAIDYVRQTPSENYGWNMREARRDSIAAARYFLAAHPTITRCTRSGSAWAATRRGARDRIARRGAQRRVAALRLLGRVEGANNLIEEYTVIRAVARRSPMPRSRSRRSSRRTAVRSRPHRRYAELTNVARAPTWRRCAAP